MKKHIVLYFLSLSLLLLSGSCEKDLDIAGAGEQKIVLLGELVAGDSIYLRAGASTVIKSGAVINEALIQDLDISVNENNGTSISLSGHEDDLSFTEHTLAFFSGRQSKAGSTYAVTASHPELGVAHTSITIPEAFEASVVNTAVVDFKGESCVQMDIQINDNAGKNYYVVELLQQPFSVEPSFLFNGQWIKTSENFEIYDSLQNAGVVVAERLDTFAMRMFNRITCYTTDAQSEHLLNGNSNTQCRRVLLDDKGFNGSVHHTTVFIPVSQLIEGYRTLIQVKSVAEDYFIYLKGYEQYDPFSGFSETNTPVRLTGNITNGVGMIGGVFKREFIYYF